MQSSLFEQTPELIGLPDGELLLDLDFLPAEQAQQLLVRLLKSVSWQSETIRIAGVERLVPRLTAWYGDQGASYTYSGILHQPQAWEPELLELKTRVEIVSGCKFNSALLNLYRNGQDSVAWHSDDEPELGPQPVIASLSLGAARTFQMKHKKDKSLRHKLSLTSGSLLIMRGATQHHWLHQVPKEAAVQSPRINITFRLIKPTNR